MNMYERILNKLSSRLELRLVSPEKVNQLTLKFPSLRSDYLTFLREVGWGNFGGMVIYSGPVEPEDIYPTLAAELNGILLFGDDRAGTSFGFDRGRGDSLVAIIPGGRVMPIDEDFNTLVEGYAS